MSVLSAENNSNVCPVACNMSKQIDVAWENPENTKNKQKDLCTILEIQGSQYCQETTLHGFQYLTKPGYLTKIFWLCVIVSCFALVIYMGIYNNYMEYMKV